MECSPLARLKAAALDRWALWRKPDLRRLQPAQLRALVARLEASFADGQEALASDATALCRQLSRGDLRLLSNALAALAEETAPPTQQLLTEQDGRFSELRGLGALLREDAMRHCSSRICDAQLLQALYSTFSAPQLVRAMASVTASLQRCARLSAKQHAEVLIAGPAEAACLGQLLSTDDSLRSLFLHVSLAADPPVLPAHIAAFSYLLASLQGNCRLQHLEIQLTGFATLTRGDAAADRLLPALTADLEALLLRNSLLRTLCIRGSSMAVPLPERCVAAVAAVAAAVPQQKRVALAVAASRSGLGSPLAQMPLHLARRIIDQAAPLQPCRITFCTY